VYHKYADICEFLWKVIVAIERFLTAWNEAPRPFVSTATVEKRLTKVERARQEPEVLRRYGVPQVRRDPQERHLTDQHQSI